MLYSTELLLFRGFGVFYMTYCYVNRLMSAMFDSSNSCATGGHTLQSLGHFNIPARELIARSKDYVVLFRLLGTTQTEVRAHLPSSNELLVFALRCPNRALHPAVLEDLNRQRSELQYGGPLSGHTGAVTALSFNRMRYNKKRSRKV